VLAIPAVGDYRHQQARHADDYRPENNCLNFRVHKTSLFTDFRFSNSGNRPLLY